MANLKVILKKKKKAVFRDRKQLVVRLYFWRTRLAGGGVWGEIAFCHVRWMSYRKWSLSQQLGASQWVSSELLLSLIMGIAGSCDNLPGETPPCPAVQAPGSAPMMWTIYLPVLMEKDSQNCLLVSMQLFLSFFRTDWCFLIFPNTLQKHQWLYFQRMKFGINVITEFGF